MPMILGAKIKIKTDQKNLLYITNCETNRAQRWKILIDEYNAELEHVEGKANLGPDSLFRCFYTSIERSQENNLNLVALEKLTNEATNLQGYTKTELTEEKINNHKLFVDERKRIVIPEAYERTLLTRMHMELGHPGINR
ncbi:Transposon Tf2-8 polyprotein, partial [Nosema granulosis]